VATAALEEGVITANTTVFSTGGVRIGSSFFADWRAGGHGATNVRKAIADSVNTFFYYIGGGYESFVGLGVDRLVKWLRLFGLGTRTGIDLPGERPGFVPDADWKAKTKGERWYVGDTYNLSIGQGDLLVTPLQVASYTSTIADSGIHITPHVAQAFIASDGTETPIDINRATSTVASLSSIQIVRQGMRETVVSGSGRSLSNLPFSVAGKTGTAQWRNDRATHAWFTSFAPYEKPEIVVTVLIEEGGEGSLTAIPVARQILQAWWQDRKGTR
jgi:penicillin-binding protein 2